MSFTKQIADYTYSTNNLLGTGAFSQVYLCQHPQKGSLAVKVLPLKLMSESLLHSLLTRELPILNCLNSKFVVQLHDVILTKQNVYVVMEYCKHGDLEDFVKKNGGKLNENQAWKLLKDLSYAFQELVRNNILHRDLKPANIFIDDQGNYKLGDFGLAKQIQVKTELKNSFVGTPIYMSPQCLKNTGYNSKTDIWSLGVLLFELLYGTTPWPCRSQIELIANLQMMKLQFPAEPAISNKMKNLIAKCLVQDENQRISWDGIFQEIGVGKIGGNLPLQTKDQNCQQKTNSLDQYQKLTEGVLNYEIRKIIENAKELDKGSSPKQQNSLNNQENTPEEPSCLQQKQEKPQQQTFLPLKKKSKFGKKFEQESFKMNDQCIESVQQCIKIFNFLQKNLEESQTFKKESQDNEMKKFSFLLQKTSLALSSMLKKCLDESNPLQLENFTKYIAQSKLTNLQSEFRQIFQENWQKFSSIFRELNSNDNFIKLIISDSKFWQFFNCQYDQGFNEIQEYTGIIAQYLQKQIEILKKKLDITFKQNLDLIPDKQLDTLILSNLIDCHQIFLRCQQCDFNFQKFANQNNLSQILVKHSQQFLKSINSDYFSFLKSTIKQLQI